MGILAAIYYWFPKMFGSCMNERIGIIQFILQVTTIGAYWNQITSCIFCFVCL